jgi:hypothetical protein
MWSEVQSGVWSEEMAAYLVSVKIGVNSDFSMAEFVKKADTTGSQASIKGKQAMVAGHHVQQGLTLSRVPVKAETKLGIRSWERLRFFLLWV